MRARFVLLALCTFSGCVELKEAPRESTNATDPAPAPTENSGRETPSPNDAIPVDANDDVTVEGTSGADGGIALTPRVTAISAGDQHACALLADGGVRCWGSNQVGQLEVPVGLTASAIATGAAFSCAIRKADAGLVCWGGNTKDGIDYIRKPPAGRFTAIAAGDFDACALREGSGAVECWGILDTDTFLVPTTPMTTLTLSSQRACALASDGTMTCWGMEPGYTPPPAVAGELVAIALTRNVTYGLTATGEIHFNALPKASKLLEPPLRAFKAITASTSGAVCGIATDDTVQCWGTDIAARAGSVGGPAIAVAVGSNFGCAITRITGKVGCWGRDAIAKAIPNDIAL